MQSSISRFILGMAFAITTLVPGQACAQSDFDLKGLKFGMKPAQVKKYLAKLGPVSDKTLIEFKWYDTQNKPTGIAGYKFCIVKNSSCKETYVIGFTEMTQQSFHMSRNVSGSQIAPLKSLALQLSEKYKIAKLDQVSFDDNSPYWVLYFSQNTSGEGELLAGQTGKCAAFSYGGSAFDSSLQLPGQSLFSCPEIMGAIQLNRNGAVRDLADSMSLLATNHKILNTSLIESTKRRLQKEDAIRDATKDNRVEL